jgi:polar amino acid transport system substrate-binding protein
MLTLTASLSCRAIALGVLSLAALSATAQTAPLRTGVDATFAPHAMVKLGGGLQGFNIELGEELARRMGRKIEIEGTEFSGLVPGLNAKKYDFLLAPVTVTAERAKAMLFTEGYMNADFTFVTKKGAAPITLDGLKGKTIAVNKGSAYESWAKENAEKYGFKYDVFGTSADATQAVVAGRADTTLVGNTVAGWAAKQNPAVQTSLTMKVGNQWALAFRADDKAGRDAASMALKCMKQDGFVGRIAEKWFGFKPEADSVAVKVEAGTGVPGFEGYDPTPVVLKCA